MGGEHQVELAGVGERAPLAAGFADVGVCEFVEAVPDAAAAAVGHRVGEVVEMADASHTAGGLSTAASSPTTSWRAWTMLRHQWSLMLRSSSTPSGP